MIIVSLLSVFLSVILLLAGLLILLRNPKDLVNRAFFAICIFSSLWSISFEWSYYFFIGAVNKDLIVWLDTLNQISFFLAILLLISVVTFTFYFPKELPKKRLNLFLILALPVSVLSFTELISGSVLIENGSYIFTSGRLVWLYLITMLVGVGIVILNLLTGYRHKGMTEKQQRKLLILGFATSLIVGSLLAIVAPLAWPDQKYDIASPLALLFFIIPVAIAIRKNRLFDLRLIVARSLGYLLSLGLIIAASSVVLFGLSTALTNLGFTEDSRIWLYIALTIFFSLAYQPIKRTFDAITNKIFYRDAYKTQDLLNEFNQTIVSTIDLQQLLERSSKTIEKYLKPDFCDFAIRNSESDSIRLISSEKVTLSKEAVEQIRAYIHKNQERIVVTDLLDDTQTDLKSLLQGANIGMMIRITSDVSVEGIGYIVLGYKKSGNIYNSQDTSAIEILSNELAIAIQNALQFEEIQKFNITLQEKVDDATRRLRKTNDKLKQMDETKDEFISMASHQLRTPLTSVKGYISMVIEGDAGDLNKMQKKLLDQAFISSQRMVYLIADLLNVSRLRTGKFVIETAPTNLGDVIQGEVDQLVETAASRGLELTYDRPKEFPNLMLDETKIRQVIMNFIDNAIYYTPSGGHIKVALKETSGSVEYTVTDDGIGVPKNEQAHMFSKFYRANNAKKARPDGTGLGLFMAKKVIIAQGGSVLFKSEPGKGSTFGFSFDKKKLAVPDHLVEESETP